MEALKNFIVKQILSEKKAISRSLFGLLAFETAYNKIIKKYGGQLLILKFSVLEHFPRLIKQGNQYKLNIPFVNGVADFYGLGRIFLYLITKGEIRKLYKREKVFFPFDIEKLNKRVQNVINAYRLKYGVDLLAFSGVGENDTVEIAKEKIKIGLLKIKEQELMNRILTRTWQFSHITSRIEKSKEITQHDIENAISKFYTVASSKMENQAKVVEWGEFLFGNQTEIGVMYDLQDTYNKILKLYV